jgi:Fe2+ or Zn2+ uptake regulation protein
MKAAVVRDAATVKIRPSKPKRSTSQAKARSEELMSKEEVPTSERALNSANTSLHAIDSAVAGAWGRITYRLFNAYKEATAVAKTRSAHLHAWESAFSCLYRRELAALIDNPAHAPVRPQENAMRLARLQVGQSRPLADRRFIVEAFWCTLHIRLTLITLGRTWLEEVGKREVDYPMYHFQQWANYVKFMLRSCSLDVEKALELARSSGSHRQVTKTSLLGMRVELENFRFGLYMSNKLGSIKDQRAEMVEAAKRHGRKAQQMMSSVVRQHFANKVTPSREEEASWLAENFSLAAQTIVDEWEAIQKAVSRSTFYQEVSLKEQMEIVRAFNFGSTGHFYNCANGHTFVITECGGAMERSRCPECGSPIGGQSHRLDSTNTRAAQYDELARQANPHIMGTPWANPHWGLVYNE